MIDGLHASLAIGGLALCTLRAWQLRARDPLVTSLWLCLLFLSFGEAMQVSAIFALAGDLLGRPGAGVVVMSGCVIAGSTACRRFAYAILRGEHPGSWLRVGLPGAVVWGLVLVLFWSDAPAPLPAELRHRGFWYDGTLNSALLWWLTIGYNAWSLVVSFRALRTYAQLSRPGPVRTGLALGASGIAVGFVFTELQAVMAGLWLVGRGREFVALDAELNAAVLSICLGLIGTGVGYPSLVAQLARVRLALGRRRALRQLQPLAAYLRSVAPDNAFDLSPKDRTQLLIATGTSIRDRQRHLRHYVTPDLQRRAMDDAAKLTASPVEARALGEAAWLEVAARAKTHGGIAAAAIYDPPSQDQSLDDEVASLTRLARAHARDPKVAVLVSALERGA